MMKKIIIILHTFLVVAAYSSPFWLDWRFVICGVGIYWLQLLVFKHCVLSTAQFGDKETTFHEWYLPKLGIRPEHATLKRLLNVWIPILLIALVLLLQVILGFQPLVHI